SAEKRSDWLPSLSASTSETTPRTSGHAALPRLTSGIGRSRTTSEPSRRRTTAENACGERIITPSISACPPIYGRATPSGPTTAGWFDIRLSIMPGRATATGVELSLEPCRRAQVRVRSLLASRGAARVLAAEAIHAALRVHQALLARVKRVAGRADVDLE